MQYTELKLGVFLIWWEGGETKDQADFEGPDEYSNYKKNMSNGEMSAALGRPGALQASIRSFLNKF